MLADRYIVNVPANALVVLLRPKKSMEHDDRGMFRTPLRGRMWVQRVC